MANGMCRAEKRGIAKSRTNRRQRTIQQHYKKTSGQHSQRRNKGAAGFIGYYATKVLAARGDEVVGLDNINAYYDTRLKYARLAQNGISQDAIVEGQPTASTCYPNYRFIKLDLGNREALQRLFVTERFDRV